MVFNSSLEAGAGLSRCIHTVCCWYVGKEKVPDLQ